MSLTVHEKIYQCRYCKTIKAIPEGLEFEKEYCPVCEAKKHRRIMLEVCNR